MKATVDRRVQWTFYNNQDCACYHESVNAVFLVLLQLFDCDIPWIKVPTTVLLLETTLISQFYFMNIPCRFVHLTLKIRYLVTRYLWQNKQFQPHLHFTAVWLIENLSFRTLNSQHSPKLVVRCYCDWYDCKTSTARRHSFQHCCIASQWGVGGVNAIAGSLKDMAFHLFSSYVKYIHSDNLDGSFSVCDTESL